jgi:hypothetical protein
MLGVAGQPDSEVTICLLSNIAAAHSRVRHPEDGLPYIERAVSMSKTVFGADHPAGAAILRNYAAILRGLKRKSEAKAAERRADEIVARYARQNHLNALVNVRDLAVLPTMR